MTTTTRRVLQANTDILKARAEHGFVEVRGTTGKSLWISDNSGRGANLQTSQDLLRDAGLTRFRYQEILPALMGDPRLRRTLEEKWFYLKGQCTDKSGFYTIGKTGELVEIRGRVSVERIVYVWSGRHPLSLDVSSDEVAAKCGGRFDLLASTRPHDVAPVVVGVEQNLVQARPRVAANIETIQIRGLTIGQLNTALGLAGKHAEEPLKRLLRRAQISQNP